MAAHRARRLTFWIAGAVLAVAGVATWLALAARQSDPLTSEEALAGFRAEPGAAPAASAPRPGVYRFRATGTEEGGAGPIAITRELPATATMTVRPEGGGWYAEVAYSEQHIEGAAYLPGADGIRVTRRRTKVTFAGFGRDDRRTVDPPALFLPADPAVGTTWREVSRTGDITVRATSVVRRREDVAVGDATVSVLVVETRSVTEGAHPGTRTETVWWDPQGRVPVRWDVDMRIGGPFRFTAVSSIALLDAEPLT